MEKIYIKNVEDLINKINEGVIVVEQDKPKTKEVKDTIFVTNLKKNAYLISCLGKEDVKLSKNKKYEKYGCVWKRTSELENLMEEYEVVELGNEYGRVELRDYLNSLNWLEKTIYEKVKLEKEGK